MSEGWKYELLGKILPRFYRLRDQSPSLSTSSSQSSPSSSQQPNPSANDVYNVQWLPNFVCVPGYFKHDESIGIAMCASSEISVHSLDLIRKDDGRRRTRSSKHEGKGLKVLDLCCCPGMKYCSIADKLDARDLLIGIDANVNRMHTCKSIVMKHLRGKIMKNDKGVINSMDDSFKETKLPRCVLLNADGCIYQGTSGTVDSLVFDSPVFYKDLLGIIANSKGSQIRSSANKSSKQRERRELQKSFQAFFGGYDEIIRDKDNCDDNEDDNADLRGKYYDRILVDSECSHDGSYRRLAAMDKDTKPNAWSIFNVENRDTHMVALQKRLLSNAFLLLQDDGVLVYSTCSLQKQQNEDVVAWLLQQFPDEAELLETNVECRTLDEETICNESANLFLSCYSHEEIQVLKKQATCILTCDDIERNDEAENVLRTCKKDEEWMMKLSRFICRFVGSLDKVPATPSGGKGMLRLDRKGGTSGQFIARVRRKTRTENSRRQLSLISFSGASVRSATTSTLDNVYVKGFALFLFLYGLNLSILTISTIDPIHTQGIDSNREGFWGEKTSSVNFCENDYYVTHYIAEFWNTISSFSIVIFPLIGIFYSNPTHEWRFIVSYLTLITVGLGSVTLHTTLTSFTQSLDELPMLWMCACIFYCLADSKSVPGSNSLVMPTTMIFLAIVQTIFYFNIANFYHIFVGAYLFMVLLIIIWTIRLIWNDGSIKKKLWLSSITCYVLVGSSVWFIDMHLCEWQFFIQKSFYGLTFHVLWHFAAGLATYMIILVLVVDRIDKIRATTKSSNVAKLDWWLHMVPIVTLDDDLHEESTTKKTSHLSHSWPGNDKKKK